MAMIPILSCGKNPVLMKSVRHGLSPDYDVVHFCTSQAKAIEELPLILSGGTPSDHENNLGSQNYSASPVICVVGGGYNDEAFEPIKTAVEKTHGAKKVIWLRADMSNFAGPPTEEELWGYGLEQAERMKKVLGDGARGVEGREGSVVWY